MHGKKFTTLNKHLFIHYMSSDSITVAFVSGHTDISPEEFATHYHTKLTDAAIQNHRFVIGHAPGADTMALLYLLEDLKVPSNHITIYIYSTHVDFMEIEKKRFKYLQIPFKEGFSSFRQRDSAMTRDSNYDILWVRSPEESTGVS